MSTTGFEPAPLHRVYLDTSFIADAIVAGGRRSLVARALCERLFDAGSSVVVSDFSRIELAQTAKAIANNPVALNVSTRRRWRMHRWERYLDARAAWYDHCFVNLDALLREFVNATEIAITRDIIDASLPFMVEFHLDSYDAIPAATAFAAGASAIITMDSHFDVLRTTGQIAVILPS